MTTVAQSLATVRVDLLGPVQVRVDDQPVAAGGPKLRAVVAMLALAGGRIVSVDDLLDGVWGENLTATARNTLQYHVAVLRKTLTAHGAGGRLLTREPGYALAVETDATRFAALASAGARAAAGGDHEQASASYAAALDEWQGHALADLREFDFAVARAVALEGQRLTCAEAWADAELACGRADALVPALHDLVTENPTRERLWEQLMVALYRTGRQDAALSAYRGGPPGPRPRARRANRPPVWPACTRRSCATTRASPPCRPSSLGAVRCGRRRSSRPPVRARRRCSPRREG